MLRGLFPHVHPYLNKQGLRDAIRAGGEDPVAAFLRRQMARAPPDNLPAQHMLWGNIS